MKCSEGDFNSNIFSLNDIYLRFKNIILFLTPGLLFIFYKCLYSQRCFDVVQQCENRR